MNTTGKQIIALTVLYGVGLGLIWWAASWKAALGVFIVCWAVRTELRFEGR